MKKCVTHHHACDCREARFAELEAENQRLREAIQEHKDAHVGEELWVIEPDRKLWAALEEGE